MDKYLDLLPYASVLDAHQQGGFTLSQIAKLEDVLCPIPIGLVNEWSPLQFFDGISINLYTTQRKDGEFRLFPTSVSRHSRKNNFFHVDLMIDNVHIRPPKTADPQDEQVGGPRVIHSLLITNLSTLLGKFSNPHNYRRNRHSCRMCLKTFSDADTLIKHYATCGEMRRGTTGRRRTANRLIHRPYLLNKFSGKMERNGLSFKRKDVGKMLKPLCFVCAGN